VNTSVNTRRMLSKKDLGAFVSDLIGASINVIAPVRRHETGSDKVEYRPVHNPDEIFLSGPPPARPLKEVVFPPSEPLFKWKQKKSSIEIEEVPTSFKETVVVGARPCDAAALDIVDKVMGWDYRDELWFGRRQSVTVVSLACSECDDSCFCTAVGLSPSSARGADWFLTPAGEGYLVEILTPKGEKLLERCKDRCPETNVEAPPSGLEDRLPSNLKADPGTIRTWLEKHFDDPYWNDVALRCHGCGACAYVCPTCHCFDIVDEPDGVGRGERRRNWDACQPALFTLHGSGHNPRKDQTARFRQRIMHKFNIYPDRFGDVLCTGCGRCMRVCAAGMDLIGILSDISRMAGKESA
jgi:ferredoxin